MDEMDAGLLGIMLFINFILIIVMIGTTIASWMRGWKGFSLIPLMSFVMFNWFIPFETPAMIGAWGSVIASIVMAIVGRKKKPETLQNNPENAAYAASSYSGYSNNSPVINVSPVNIQRLSSNASKTEIYRASKLVAPDGNNIMLSEATKSLGRSDFERIVSPNLLNLISRQHIFIKVENDRYYIEDHSSSNGTKINGVDVKGRGWQELSKGDRIDIAEAITMTYKTL